MPLKESWSRSGLASWKTLICTMTARWYYASRPCSLSEARRRLPDSEWNLINIEATIKIHSSWFISFNLRLEFFEGQLAGLYNRLNFGDATRSSAIQLVYTSSISGISLADRPNRPVEETINSEPDDAPPLGYSSRSRLSRVFVPR